MINKMLRKLVFGEPTVEESTLKHVPVPVHLNQNKPGDWREQKLHDAARRYGRPFKCADYSMDREFISAPGALHFAKACTSAVRPQLPKNVRKLEAKKGTG